MATSEASAAALLSRLSSTAGDYRQSPSPELADALVDIRYAAGRAQVEESQAGETMWHMREYDSPDPALGLPEIPGSALTAESLAQTLLRYGALVVRNLLDADALSRLNTRFDAIDITQPPPLFGIGCEPEDLELLLDVMWESGFADAAADYFGEEPVLLGERAKLRRSGVEKHRRAAIAWHQDVNFFGRPLGAVNCWLAVSECGKDNPGLAFLPKRVNERIGWDDEALAPLDYGQGMTDEDVAGLAPGFAISLPGIESR